MTAGDGCNTFEVTLFTHNGTHIDLPNHYHADGRRLDQYDISELIFGRPVLVRLDGGPGQAISGAMLKPFIDVIRGKDLLLLRTGFGARRASADYLDSPYLTLDAAKLLSSVAGLRALGIDFLSVTNPRRRELGDEVHRVLLGDAPHGKPLVIVEDLDLSQDAVIDRFRRVFVVPLYVEGVDGMPCTVFGEYD